MKSGTELCDEEMREDVAFVPYDEHKARSKSKSLCHKVSLCHKREGWLILLRVGVRTPFQNFKRIRSGAFTLMART